MTRQFSEKDYREYLIRLIPSVHKILYLYEERNEFILECMDSLLRFELYGASESIGNLPKSRWYGESVTKLEGIEKHIRDGSNPDVEAEHERIRREILDIMNMINKQVDSLKGG